MNELGSLKILCVRHLQQADHHGDKQDSNEHRICQRISH